MSDVTAQNAARMRPAGLAMLDAIRASGIGDEAPLCLGAVGMVVGSVCSATAEPEHSLMGVMLLARSIMAGTVESVAADLAAYMHEAKANGP